MIILVKLHAIIPIQYNIILPIILALFYIF